MYTIPNSVTSIGNYAFNGCCGLTSLTIPNSVTSIGSYAFYGCSGLTSLTIPNSVTSIGNYAFNGCSGLTSLTIPSTVDTIGTIAFGNCAALKSIIVDPANKAYCSVDGIVFNKSKDTIIIYPGNAGSMYTIPNSVTSISIGAFFGCGSLNSVTIPNSVTTIDMGAFYGCRSLTSVTIPNSVTSIGSYAFYDCSGLTSVTISNSVTSIGDYAFNGCMGLTSVTIPNSVTSIGEGAFHYCISLTEATIPNSVTSIGNYAFGFCSGLIQVIIPPSVKSVGESAFSGCSGLKKSAYPLTVSNPFDNGTVVPYDPNGAVVEDGFIFGSNKTNIRFAPYTLAGNFTIPDSVSVIGPWSFSECKGLTAITIPNSVTSIGTDAFMGCDSLMEVNSDIENPFAINDVFDNATLNEGVLRVISGTIDKYRAVAQWNQFANIKEDRVSSVPEVDGDSDEVFSVYGMDGVMLRCNCTLSELDTLPKGVYILVLPSGRLKIVR